jgi:hypothetical protein
VFGLSFVTSCWIHCGTWDAAFRCTGQNVGRAWNRLVVFHLRYVLAYTNVNIPTLRCNISQCVHANRRQHQIRSVIKLVASPTTFRQFPLLAIGHESMTNTWRWPASKLFFVPASCPTHDLCTAWYHLTSPICALNYLSLVGYVLEDSRSPLNATCFLCGEVLQGRVSECRFPEPHLGARHVSPGVGLACRAPSLVGGRWREDGEVQCSEQEFMHEAADYHDRHPYRA